MDHPIYQVCVSCALGPFAFLQRQIFRMFVSLYSCHDLCTKLSECYAINSAYHNSLRLTFYAAENGMYAEYHEHPLNCLVEDK